MIITFNIIKLVKMLLIPDFLKIIYDKTGYIIPAKIFMYMNVVTALSINVFTSSEIINKLIELKKIKRENNKKKS